MEAPKKSAQAPALAPDATPAATSVPAPVPAPSADAGAAAAQEQTRWLNENEQLMWLELREFARGLPRALDRQLLEDADVSGVEYSILAAVSESSQGALRSGDLAATLGWERSRVSHLLKRMESRGFLHRCAARSDGRGQEIALTQAGWEKIRGAAPGHVTMVREVIFDPRTPAAQNQLLETLILIRHAAEERGLW